MEHVYPYDKEFGGNVLRTDYTLDIGNYRSYIFNKKGTEAMCWALKRKDEEKVDEALDMINKENNVLVDWNIIAGCAVEYDNMSIFNYITNRRLLTNWNHVLAHAARIGNMSWITKAIQNGATDMNSGLEYASEGGDEKVVQYFIRNNNNVNWLRGLIGASKGGHMSLVKYFASRVPEYEYARPIFAALQKDRENVVDFLMESFSDVNYVHKSQFYFSLGMSLNKYLIDNYIGNNQNDEIIKGLAYKGDLSLIQPLLLISEDVTYDLMSGSMGAGMRGDPVFIEQFLELDKKFSTEENDHEIIIATIVNAAIEANNVGVIEKYMPYITDETRHIIEDSVLPAKDFERMENLLENYGTDGGRTISKAVESGNLEVVKKYVRDYPDISFYINKGIIRASELNMSEIFVYLVKLGRTSVKVERPLSQPVLRRQHAVGLQAFNSNDDLDSPPDIPAPEFLPMPNFQDSPESSVGVIDYDEPPEVGSAQSTPPAQYLSPPNFSGLPMPNFQNSAENSPEDYPEDYPNPQDLPMPNFQNSAENSPVNFGFPTPPDGKQIERKIPRGASPVISSPGLSPSLTPELSPPLATDRKTREIKTRELKRYSPPEEIARKPYTYYGQGVYPSYQKIVLEDKDVMKLYDKLFTDNWDEYYSELLLKTIKEINPLDSSFLRKRVQRILKLYSKFVKDEPPSESVNDYYTAFSLYKKGNSILEYLRIICKYGPYFNIEYYIGYAIGNDLDRIAKYLMKFQLDYRPTDVNPEEAYKQNY